MKHIITESKFLIKDIILRTFFSSNLWENDTVGFKDMSCMQHETLNLLVTMVFNTNLKLFYFFSTNMKLGGKVKYSATFL